MKTNSTRRATRLTAPIAAALGALILASGSASAATELTTSGNIGQYAVSDAMGDAVCSYGQSGALEAIVIENPEFYARNRTAGVDAQQVGWRVIVKKRRSGPDQPWTTLSTSAVYKAWATDATPANLNPYKLAMAFPDSSSFRVIVKTFWYRADGSTAGWAKTRIESYTAHSQAFGDEYPNESCASFGV